MSCDCALRSFWDGPCPDCYIELQKARPETSKFSDYGAAVKIEFNKMFDTIIEQAAAELGMAAGKAVHFKECSQETPDV